MSASVRHAKHQAAKRRHWHKMHPLEAAGASWFDGSTFACGSWRGPNGLGVAHKTLPCGTKVRLCYRRCSFAWVVDRGPFIAGREWDLLPETKAAIGFGDVGDVHWRLAWPGHSG